MRKAGVALSAFALALTLGACGDNTTNGTPSTGSNTGADAPAAAANVADLAKSISDQAVEKTSAHMKMTGDFGGETIEGEGDVSFDAANPAMSMDLTTSEGNMSMVLLDGIVYIKMPDGQELEPGKPWLKVDSNSDSPFAEVFGQLSDQLSESADPRSALEQFKETGEITDTKEEKLEGKQTTHYTITVDVQKLADSQEDPTQKAALETAIEAGLKDFPVDVWIDEDQLPVRISFDMPAPDGQGGTATAKMQVDYTGWGEPVDIAAPPADQVTEFPTS
ncbi:hypothetical protein [Actinophytocola sp.]|uniref:hypothetical protein n=1 Tax=Actinophytocola sp. TaxID=1872138 RepID=UPI002ED01372